MALHASTLSSLHLHLLVATVVSIIHTTMVSCYITGYKGYAYQFPSRPLDIAPYTTENTTAYLISTTSGILLLDWSTMTHRMWFNGTVFRGVRIWNDTYFSLNSNENVIRRHYSNGSLIDIWCGDGTAGTTTDCTRATFKTPYSFMILNDVFYVFDTSNGRILKIDPTTKKVSRFWKLSSYKPACGCPGSSTGDPSSSFFWFTVDYHIYKAYLNGTAELIVGQDNTTEKLDGPAGLNATVSASPYGCLEWGDYVYFSDKGFGAVRRFHVDFPHPIETVAGNGLTCGEGNFDSVGINHFHNFILLDGLLYSPEFYCNSLAYLNFNYTAPPPVPCLGTASNMSALRCLNGVWVTNQTGVDDFNQGTWLINSNLNQSFSIHNASISIQGNVEGYNVTLKIQGNLSIAGNVKLVNSVLKVDANSVVRVDGNVIMVNLVIVVDLKGNAPPSPGVPFMLLSLNNMSIASLDNLQVILLNVSCVNANVEIGVSSIFATFNYDCNIPSHGPPLVIIISSSVAFIALLVLIFGLWRLRRKDSEVKKLLSKMFVTKAIP